MLHPAGELIALAVCGIILIREQSSLQDPDKSINRYRYLCSFTPQAANLSTMAGDKGPSTRKRQQTHTPANATTVRGSRANSFAHLWQPQDGLGAGGGQAVVAVESPLQPPPEARAVDGRDHRDALLGQDVERRVSVHADLAIRNRRPPCVFRVGGFATGEKTSRGGVDEHGIPMGHADIEVKSFRPGGMAVAPRWFSLSLFLSRPKLMCIQNPHEPDGAFENYYQKVPGRELPHTLETGFFRKLTTDMLHSTNAL